MLPTSQIFAVAPIHSVAGAGGGSGAGQGARRTRGVQLLDLVFECLTRRFEFRKHGWLPMLHPGHYKDRCGKASAGIEGPGQGHGESATLTVDPTFVPGVRRALRPGTSSRLCSGMVA